MSSIRALLSASVAMAVTATALAAAAPAQAAVVSEQPQPFPSFNGVVHDIVYTDDVVYVAGAFTFGRDAAGQQFRDRVAAVDAATGEILPWRPKVEGGDVLSIDVTAKSVVLGGEFTTVNGEVRKHIALVNRATGGLRKKLAGPVNGAVRTLTVAHGRVYVGGSFTQVNGTPRKRLAAFDFGTGNLTAWRPRADRDVNVIQPVRKKIYIGGDFTTLNGSKAAGFLSAVRKNGTIIQSFAPPVSVEVFDIEGYGKRVYVASGGPGGKFIKLSLTGKRFWHVTFDGDAQALTRVDGVLYVGGHFDNVCKTRRVNVVTGDCKDNQIRRGQLAAFEADADLLAWAPNTDSARGVVAMERSPQGRLGIGGAFVDFEDGTRHPCFAEFTLP